MFKLFNSNNEPVKKNIVIIGAGVSGLMAGIHALMLGHDVTILEKNNVSGGKLNMDDRHYFNYFPKYINGVKEFNYLLREIGINKKIHSVKNLPVLYSSNTGMYVVKSDLKEFEYFLKYNSKDDDERVKDLLSIIKNCANYKKEYIAPYELSSIVDKAKLKAREFLTYSVFKNYGDMTIKEYVDTFNSPVIKDLLSAIMIENQSVINLFMVLSSFFSHNLGKLNFNLSLALEEKYKELGGKILFNKDCEKLYFEKLNVAKTLLYKDNEGTHELDADYFISSTDPYYTYESLLNKKYKDRKFYLRYEDYQKYPVDTKLLLVFKTNKEFKFDDVVLKNDNLKIGINYVKYIKFYKATRGKDYIYCTVEQNYKDYEYLKTISSKKGLLKDYFKEVVSEVKQIFKENFKDYNIDIVDLLSPLGIESRYNSYKGSATGFINAKDQYDIVVDGIIPEVKNVLLCSSWLNSTSGILNAMITGKFSIKRLEMVIKNGK